MKAGIYLESIMSDSPCLAIVVPCFNEQEVIEETADQLSHILSSLVENNKIGANSYIYFVDDGSKDRTWELIVKLHEENKFIKGLKLSNNVGHQNALLAGMTRVMEHGIDCVISIDADLQDDVLVIEEFIDRYLEGYDVVYGVRQDRGTDTIFKKYTALFFYRLMLAMGVNIIYNHADYRLASRRVLKALSDFREVNLFLRGIFPIIGFKHTTVCYDRKERFAGESKYPFKKMLAFALDGITSFSVVPLRFITLTGITVFILSFLMGIWVFMKAMFIGGNVPGWASTVLPIYVLGGIQIAAIGILGEYLGKTYQEVKARPRFILDIELF